MVEAASARTAMTYQLWDTQSGNAIGEFDTKIDALRDVLEAVKLNGDDSVAPFLLIAVSDSGAIEGIASGVELVELARRRFHILPA